MSEREENDISFLQRAVLLKMKRQKERKRKYLVWELFGKGEEKGALNNSIQEMKLVNRVSFLGTA